MARKPLGGRGPIRRIVKTCRQTNSPIAHDLLDCGHTLPRLDDVWNYTLRPCWKCERGDTPKTPPSPQ